MTDFLTQVYAAFKRRRLTYILAVLALASGVAAYLCICAVIESQFLPRVAELHKAASQPPHFHVTVTSYRKEGETVDESGRLRSRFGRQRNNLQNAKTVPINLDRLAEVAQAGFAKEHCVEAAFTTRLTIEGRRLSGVYVRGYSNGDFMPLVFYDATRLEGRLLRGEDTRGPAPVCVINPKLAEVLFQGIDPVGQKIDIGAADVQVVGVAGNGGSPAGVPQVYMPLRLARRLFPEESKALIGVTVYVYAGEETIEAEMAEAELTLGARANEGWSARADSPWQVARDRLAEIDKDKNSLGYVAVGLLLVGLLGVTDMLLANIAGRIREIGVHRALGATRARQAVEVLLQAGLVGLAGGLVGVGAGFGVIRLLEIIFDAELAITAHWIAVAIIASTVASLVAGLIPARAAMRISPMEALREE